MENSALILVYFGGVATGLMLYFLFTVAVRTRKQQLDQQMSGLSEQFTKLDQLVHDYDRERQRQYGALDETLRRLNDTTHSLQKTLANERLRGAWGQQIADGILEAAGFLRGTHYECQERVDNRNGSYFQPDYTFFLPNNFRIHMDVKFPYTNYEGYFAAEVMEDGQREQMRKRFAKDVKSRIDETRKYINVDTLDCALMFIPNETIFHFLSEDDELRDHALKSRVIICSPLSLLIVLAMIRQAVDAFALEKSLGKIRAGLIQISQDIEGYAAEMDGVNDDIAKMQSRIADLQHKRGNKLQSDARKLREWVDQQSDEFEAPTTL